MRVCKRALRACARARARAQAGACLEARNVLGSETIVKNRDMRIPPASIRMHACECMRACVHAYMRAIVRARALSCVRVCYRACVLSCVRAWMRGCVCA